MIFPLSDQVSIRGVTLGAGAFGGAVASSVYSNATCSDAVPRLASMGATHVQLLVPLWVNATRTPSAPYALAAGPLATPSVSEIAACAGALASAGFAPMVSIVVLPDYSIPGLCRDPLAPCFADPATIGAGLSAAGAAGFLAAFKTLVKPFVIAVARVPNASFELAHGNDALLLNAAIIFRQMQSNLICHSKRGARQHQSKVARRPKFYRCARTR